MHKERLLSSYLIRFCEADERVFVKLQNLRTGEQLSFETWLAAWAFLDETMETAQLASLDIVSSTQL